jgi:hypothetical protein
VKQRSEDGTNRIEVPCSPLHHIMQKTKLLGHQGAAQALASVIMHSLTACQLCRLAAKCAFGLVLACCQQRQCPVGRQEAPLRVEVLSMGQAERGGGP